MWTDEIGDKYFNQSSSSFSVCLSPVFSSESPSESSSNSSPDSSSDYPSYLSSSCLQQLLLAEESAVGHMKPVDEHNSDSKPSRYGLDMN